MTDYLDSRFDPNDPAFASAVDEVSLWSSNFGRLLLDNLAMARGVTVLDLGFGNGFPLIELANRYGRSSRFLGLDVWKPAVERAAEKIRTQGLKNVTVLRGDGARMPFADRSFDLLVSNVGVNNFAEPEQALAECGRVTKTGGTLALTTNPRGHLADFYDEYREVLRSVGLGDCVAALDEEEAHRATEPKLRELLGGGGFQTVRVVEDEFYLRFLDGSTFLRHALVRFGFLDGWRSVVPDEEEARVFPALEDALNTRAARDGQLAFRVPMIYVEARRAA